MDGYNCKDQDACDCRWAYQIKRDGDLDFRRVCLINDRLDERINDCASFGPLNGMKEAWDE